MKTKINKKEFEQLFLPYKEQGKQMWVVSNINELPVFIVNMAIRLAELDFIRYLRISKETLAASSENYPKRPKVPVTVMDHPTAIGIQILYDMRIKCIDFFDINSPVKGNGSKMVDAVLKDFPADWQATVVLDWSEGFWDKMKEKHTGCKWLM